MDIFTKILHDKKEKYESLQGKCIEYLKNAPEGNLRVSNTKGNTTFYRTNHRADKRKNTYLSKKEIEPIKNLAQKEYCIKLQKILGARINQINKLLATYEEDELIKPYIQSHPAKQKLMEPFELPFEEYAQAWERKEYPSRKFKEDDAEIYTERGERVLSKSEKIIADKLYMSGIHYRYEYPFYVDSYLTLHPDFTLLHPLTRREWIWEHMGMMDHEEYSEKALAKIDTYAQLGYFPGVNLILTHETKKHPLNMRTVMNMIEMYGFLEKI